MTLALSIPLENIRQPVVSGFKRDKCREMGLQQHNTFKHYKDIKTRSTYESIESESSM